MLYLRYIASELRRRRGRTILTALGLGVGVGLVVTVTALSAGLDDAQSEVLEPLTGVGTDMTVNRPVQIGAGGDAGDRRAAQLSVDRAAAARKEGAGPPQIDFSDLGDPGEKFSTDQFVTTDLSFPASEVKRIAATDGVEAVSPALTPEPDPHRGHGPRHLGERRRFAAPSGGPPRRRVRAARSGFDPTSVTGIDASEPDLGLVKADQVTDGRFLRGGDDNAALLTQTYADENDLAVGDRVEVGDASSRSSGS